MLPNYLLERTIVRCTYAKLRKFKRLCDILKKITEYEQTFLSASWTPVPFFNAALGISNVFIEREMVGFLGLDAKSVQCFFIGGVASYFFGIVLSAIYNNPQYFTDSE